MDWGMGSMKEEIARRKRWAAYYLYLLKYYYIDTDGRFAFEAFRRRAADYVIQLSCLDLTIRAEILSARDFLTIKTIFLDAVEVAYKAGKRIFRESFDANRQIESAVNLKGWYIADKQEYLAYWRYYGTSLEELQKTFAEEILKDVNAINEIDGIQPISMDFVSRLLSQLAQSSDFEEFEQALEFVSAMIWNLIEPISNSLLCELEKTGAKTELSFSQNSDTQRQRLPCAFWEYARELENVAFLVQTKAKNKNKRDKQKEKSLNADVSDFYVDR